MGIPEYWIVDPLKRIITLLQLNEGFYDETVFTVTQTLQSPLFPDLSLKVEAILAAGNMG